MKSNDFMWFFLKIVIKLLIREFSLSKCGFKRDANLNECGFKRRFIVYIIVRPYL